MLHISKWLRATEQVTIHATKYVVKVEHLHKAGENAKICINYENQYVNASSRCELIYLKIQ